jgi:hypothetical protein
MQMRACLVVAVDIDDTLVLTVSAFKIWVDSKNGGPLFSRWSQYQREMQLASSEWRELAMKAGLFDDLPPVPGAKKGLEVLANAGIRLEAMTSRPESMRDVTMALLDKHFPKIFSDVHLTGGREHKGDLCQRRGINVLLMIRWSGCKVQKNVVFDAFSLISRALMVQLKSHQWVFAEPNLGRMYRD